MEPFIPRNERSKAQRECAALREKLGNVEGEKAHLASQVSWLRRELQVQQESLARVERSREETRSQNRKYLREITRLQQAEVPEPKSPTSRKLSDALAKIRDLESVSQGGCGWSF